MFLGACATTTQVHLSSSFDPSEVAWSEAKGNNSIEGNAVLRTVGGEVRTCAGFTAQLVPRSRYADERAIAIYGSIERGIGRNVKFESTDPRYEAAIRTTTCDAQGNFSFEDLPDGEYYVAALVTWGVPMGYGMVSRQGGWLMQRVSVNGGEHKRMVLSQ
jgi:hypothetical protein